MRGNVDASVNLWLPLNFLNLGRIRSWP